jgi:hypothetical protein
MDTYSNQQAVGIEPPRLRGLETDPAMAPAVRSAPGGGGSLGPMAASVEADTSGLLAAAGGGAGPDGAVHRSLDTSRSMPGGSERHGGSAWHSPSDARRPPAPGSTGGDGEEDAAAWRGTPDRSPLGSDVRQSGEAGVALAGPVAAGAFADLRLSSEASTGLAPSPGGGGGVSLLRAVLAR